MYIICMQNVNRVTPACFNNIRVPVTVILVQCGDRPPDMHLACIPVHLIGLENDSEETYSVISRTPVS